MRGPKGLTKGQSIFYHVLQQAMAFVLVTCIMLLVFYSCTDRYGWNLFAREEKFEDTEDFDYMLVNSLHEIVRYNVIKSQLETNGFFDGKKVININAYVNRKEDAEGVTAYYYLEDLLKWGKWGFYDEYEIMDADTYLVQAGLSSYKVCDGVLNEAQFAILQNNLGDETAQAILQYCNGNEVSYYSGMDAGMETDMDTVTEENMEMAEVVYLETSYPVNGMSMIYNYEPQVYDILTEYMLYEKGKGTIGNIYFDDSNDQLMVSAGMLYERYKTVDGKYLKDMAADGEEYQVLCSLLQQASYDLSYNYEEYLNFQEKYENGTSNMAYSFKMSMMGENVLITNVPTLVESKLDDYFRTNYGKYIIYKPQSMTFETNTGLIKESNLFTIFSEYSYAYPETAKIWLAVDTTYPANDHFSEAADAYATLHPWAYWLTGVAGVAGLIWIALFLYLSVQAGNRRNKGEEESVLTLHWFDAIYTEVYICMGFIAYLAIWILGKTLMNSSLADIYAIGIGRTGLSLFCGVTGGLVSALVCLFWYSLIRRIKGRILWKRSLLYCIVAKILIKAAKKLEKLWFIIYDNGNVVLWFGLPLVGAMGFNIVAGVMLCYASYDGASFLLFMLLVLAIDIFMLYFWLRNRIKRKHIVEGIAKIKDGEIGYQVNTEGMHGENLELANAVNSIGEGIKVAVETSMKDERLKADLITNVSHDIKTPLTSIINYVDLLKREKIEEEPIKGYIEVLDAKSQRLKQLTDDLVEASKISSGNITLVIKKINLTELVHQTIGEFSERFEQKNLSVVTDSLNEAVYIEADPGRIWRVMENLFGNINKYAMPGTRVYLDMVKNEELQQVAFSVKNISAQPLNIRAEELTERFIRGDVSRSTEGSGLGLSIARNLTELQNGKFEIYLDGDLFKVSLTFPIVEK